MTGYAVAGLTWEVRWGRRSGRGSGCSCWEAPEGLSTVDVALLPVRGLVAGTLVGAVCGLAGGAACAALAHRVERPRARSVVVLIVSILVAAGVGVLIGRLLGVLGQGESGAAGDGAAALELLVVVALVAVPAAIFGIVMAVATRGSVRPRT